MSRWIVKLLVILWVSVVLAGCGTIALPPTAAPTPAASLPDFVRKAPALAQETYRYAEAHPHEMEKYPCYCGCVQFGHMSLRDCFIKDIAAVGKVTFDDHAAGCGICVLIAQDVIRLSGEGKSSREIRTYIDAHYDGFGPSTNTPFPAA